MGGWRKCWMHEYDAHSEEYGCAGLVELDNFSFGGRGITQTWLCALDPWSSFLKLRGRLVGLRIPVPVSRAGEELGDAGGRCLSACLAQHTRRARCDFETEYYATPISRPNATLAMRHCLQELQRQISLRCFFLLSRPPLVTDKRSVH